MQYNPKTLNHLLKQQYEMLMFLLILKNRTPLNTT